MYEFVSNLMTYVTATLVVAGGYLAGFDQSNDPRGDAGEIAFVDPLLLTNEAHDTQGEVQVASNDILFDTNVVQPAELHSVVFSSTGAATGLGSLNPVEEAFASGTVTGSSVNLRGGPGTNFAIAGRAAGGDKLQVTGEKQGIWIEVLLPITGESAWVHGNYFDAPS